MFSNNHSTMDEIHRLIGGPLFENISWLAGRNTVAALQGRLKLLRLAKQAQGISEDWGATPLGKELNLDLIMVFLGLWDPWEVPEILLKYQLIDEASCKTFYDNLASGISPDTVLRYSVQRAYFQFYMPWSIEDPAHTMLREH